METIYTLINTIEIKDMKIILLPVIALIMTSAVQAADKPCSMNDFNGRWTAYQGAVTVNPHTGICHFSVANGLAQGNCDFSNGFAGPFKGEVVVNRNCSVDFEMDFTPVPVVSTFQVQMHKDKKSFVGRWKNNFDVIGVTNAVKR
ncbi:MAG: hypothetical protein IPN42_11790 [Methylococcaceae bacterium]|nr:hypothetical protein [Methylococcaceae bacterium]